jgi:ornithine carbamoyltransferase
MSNPLAGWKIIPTGVLREMNRESIRNERELNERVRNAKHEYYDVYKSCTSEVKRLSELERISKKYNVNKDIILEYVDNMNRYNKI